MKTYLQISESFYCFNLLIYCTQTYALLIFQLLFPSLIEAWALQYLISATRGLMAWLQESQQTKVNNIWRIIGFGKYRKCAQKKRFFSKPQNTCWMYRSIIACFKVFYDIMLHNDLVFVFATMKILITWLSLHCIITIQITTAICFHLVPQLERRVQRTWNATLCDIYLFIF